LILNIQLFILIILHKYILKMTKKYGKDTFRHSKKKILHKKRVNSKKRGLRGGLKLLSLFRSSASQPQVDNQIHGIHGSALTDSMKLSMLTPIECKGLLGQIIATPEKTLTSNAKTEVKLCKEKFYSDLEVKFPEPVLDDSSKKTEKYFDTQLSTNSSPSQTLTLRNCKVLKNPFHGEDTPLFVYRIFSPAVSTLPPIGGIQKETLVGTFTQFPVGTILKMAGQEIPFNFASFYTDDRKEYFSDYMRCLQNVKDKFYSVKPSKYNNENGQYGAFLPESSKLQTYGKSHQCKIILVAGNVGEEIQNLANNGAIFVLPSQFNGAEYLSPSAGPETTLETYKADRTGGPIGQLSCHPLPAEVVRLFAARKLPNSDDEFSSDFLVINAIGDVINTLSSLLPGMTLNNGYLEVPANLQSGEEHDLSSVENENTTAIFNALCQQLKVLLMSDIPPNGLKPPIYYSSFNSYIKKDHIVNLVYASAVPLNYEYYKHEVDSTTGRFKLTEMPPINPEKSTLQYCVAGFDLVAQYFGAMVSAYHKSKQLESTAKAGPAAAEAGKKIKLFLTPLGGGVFNNPRELIGCSVLLAYYQAQELFTDFDDKVQVNFLAWNQSSPEVYDFSKFFKPDKTAEPIVNSMQEVVNEQPVSKPSGIAPEAAGALQSVSQPQNQEENLEPSGAAETPEQKPVDLHAPDLGGGSKSRRKPVRKTRRRRGRTRTRKSKTHRRRRHSCVRVRKHKKYTSRRR
jgi:hypothetical protein